MHIQHLVGLILLAGAAVTLGYGGGLDILSADDWLAIHEKYALPGEDANRWIATGLGGAFGLLGALQFMVRPR